MKCPNCSTRLTCGCQKRVSNGGKQCCQACQQEVNQQESQQMATVKKK